VVISITLHWIIPIHEAGIEKLLEGPGLIDGRVIYRMTEVLLTF
jgi:hypothetical protein